MGAGSQALSLSSWQADPTAPTTQGKKEPALLMGTDLRAVWEASVADAALALGSDARSASSVSPQDSISRESAELRVSIDEMLRELEECAIDYAMVRRPLRIPGSHEYTETDRNAIDARCSEFLAATRRSVDALRAAVSGDEENASDGILAHHQAIIGSLYEDLRGLGRLLERLQV